MNRYSQMQEIIYESTGLPKEKLSASLYLRLTNVYDDEDNKLLAEVHLVSLILPVRLDQFYLIREILRG